MQVASYSKGRATRHFVDLTVVVVRQPASVLVLIAERVCLESRRQGVAHRTISGNAASTAMDPGLDAVRGRRHIARRCKTGLSVVLCWLAPDNADF